MRISNLAAATIRRGKIFGCMQRIQLSDHFTYGRLFRFVLPSIVTMVFVSVYGIVDGFFVSNYAGELAFAGLNLIYPVIMILVAVGFMFGAGGTAVVSRFLGQGNKDRANSVFSMLVYLTILVGVAFAVLGLVFIKPLATWLAAEETQMSAAEKAELIGHSTLYGSVLLCAMPAFMLQNLFQTFFITAEKPKLGLAFTLAAGCCNMVLDALFVAVFSWGLAGAAVATALSQCVGGLLPLLYFARKNDSLLQLGKARFDGRALLGICANGSSEFLVNVSLSLVTMLYNGQLMKYVGIGGVTAYGIVMYVSFIFISIFLGYAMGVAPVVGYNYGANTKDELRNVLKKSLIFLSFLGVGLTTVLFVFARPLSAVFVGYDEELLALTAHGAKIYAFSFLFCGLNIFASSFFTALSNGLVSAIISVLRTLVFQVAAVFTLPLLTAVPVDGIWLAVVVAECASLLVSAVFLIVNKKKYGY